MYRNAKINVLLWMVVLKVREILVILYRLAMDEKSKGCLKEKSKL